MNWGIGKHLSVNAGPKGCDPFEKNIKTVNSKDNVNTFNLEVPSCSCSSSLSNVQVMNLRYNKDS